MLQTTISKTESNTNENVLKSNQQNVNKNIAEKTANKKRRNGENPRSDESYNIIIRGRNYIILK